jgi:hypothetical protein
MRSVLEMEGEESILTNPLDTCSDVGTSLRLLNLLKENRLEMMIATILLYSTGLLEKAFTYSSGVCS